MMGSLILALVITIFIALPICTMFIWNYNVVRITETFQNENKFVIKYFYYGSMIFAFVYGLLTKMYTTPDSYVILLFLASIVNGVALSILSSIPKVGGFLFVVYTIAFWGLIIVGIPAFIDEPTSIWLKQ